MSDLRYHSETDEARKAVLRQLADAHDRFAEKEQLAWAAGDEYEAEGAHTYANLVLRAYRAESDDRTPEGLS